MEVVRLALTPEQIRGLNNMNVYAQRARLGDILANGGGGSGNASIILASSYTLFPSTGFETNLYIDTTANNIYRWDDSLHNYCMVGASVTTIVDDVSDTITETVMEQVYENVQIITGGNANG